MVLYAQNIKDLFPMLKIGKMTDYAILLLAAMAKAPDAVISAASLADQVRLSAPTVSKILKILGDANLVTSLRGADGGYLLNKSAADISVSDVIAAMEGDLAITECCDSINHCTIGTLCAMQDNWIKINGLIKELLSKLSIIDMTGPITLEGLLHGK